MVDEIEFGGKCEKHNCDLVLASTGRLRYRCSSCSPPYEEVEFPKSRGLSIGRHCTKCKASSIFRKIKGSSGAQYHCPQCDLERNGL